MIQINAVMSSLIETCKLNGLPLEKTITFLIRKHEDAIVSSKHTQPCRHDSTMLKCPNARINKHPPNKSNWKAFFYKGLRRNERIHLILCFHRIICIFVFTYNTEGVR